MKISDILLSIFVMLTITTLFPIISPDINRTLLPEEHTIIQFHLNQPEIDLSVSEDTGVNFTLYILTENGDDIIKSNSIDTQVKITGLKTGFYRLEIISSSLNELNINRTGFYPVSLGLFSLFGAINLILLNSKLSKD